MALASAPPTSNDLRKTIGRTLSFVNPTAVTAPAILPQYPTDAHGSPVFSPTIREELHALVRREAELASQRQARFDALIRWLATHEKVQEEGDFQEEEQHQKKETQLGWLRDCEAAAEHTTGRFLDGIDAVMGHFASPALSPAPAPIPALMPAATPAPTPALAPDLAPASTIASAPVSPHPPPSTRMGTIEAEPIVERIKRRARLTGSEHDMNAIHALGMEAARMALEMQANKVEKLRALVASKRPRSMVEDTGPLVNDGEGRDSRKQMLRRRSAAPSEFAQEDSCELAAAFRKFKVDAKSQGINEALDTSQKIVEMEDHPIRDVSHCGKLIRPCELIRVDPGWRGSVCSRRYCRSIRRDILLVGRCISGRHYIFH